MGVKKLVAIAESATKSVVSTLKALFDKIAEAGDFPLRESILEALEPVEPERASYRELVESVQDRSIIDVAPKVDTGLLKVGSQAPIPVTEIDSVVFYSSPEGDIDVILTEGGKDKPLSNIYSGTIRKSQSDLVSAFQGVLTTYNIASTDLAVYPKKKVPSLAL